jgi:GH15 family glucan-1,4-alpha-glucosidase
MRFPGATETDASILLPILMGYGKDDEQQRLLATVRNIRTELGSGALLYRYRGEDGMSGGEGAFLACSFWLVDALARLGEIEEANELMGELIEESNDVGLYAEEIDPASGAFLGNLPQGLVHLALINAATTLQEKSR